MLNDETNLWYLEAEVILFFLLKSLIYWERFVTDGLQRITFLAFENLIQRLANKYTDQISDVLRKFGHVETIYVILILVSD